MIAASAPIRRGKLAILPTCRSKRPVADPDRERTSTTTGSSWSEADERQYELGRDREEHAAQEHQDGKPQVAVGTHEEDREGSRFGKCVVDRRMLRRSRWSVYRVTVPDARKISATNLCHIPVVYGK